MARVRKIKRQSGKKKRSDNTLVPEGLQAFIARRLVDGIALACLAVGAFIIVSLTTYSPKDPSWNTAGIENQEMANWGGKAGAWLADLLIQSLGAGGFVFGLCAFVWGLRIFSRHGMKPVILRIAVMFLGGLGASLAFAPIPSQGWLIHPFLGSNAGTIMLDNIEALLPAVSQIIISLTAATLSLACIIYACAVTRDEFFSALHALKNASLTIGAWVINLGLLFITWIKKYNDPGYRSPELNWFPAFYRRQSSPKRGRVAPTLGEEQTQDMTPSMQPPQQQQKKSTPSQSIPVVTPEHSAAKNRAVQSRFNLKDGDWVYPDLALLQDLPAQALQEKPDEGSLRKNAELLANVLNDFNIDGEIVSIHPGPVVTLYELEPAPGVKTSRIISLADDIARSMSAVSVRCAVIPGRNVIGIELPNKKRQIVYMCELLASPDFEKTKAKLPLILGKNISGQPILADLSKMPHLLVAGTTGSGKSVAVNTMILSLLYHLPPEKCRFIMIDPKMLELSVYDDIPHLLSPVVTEPGKAVVALKWVVQEMEERYRAMSKLGVRNIEGYNARLAEARKDGETLMRKVQTGFDPDTGKPVYEEQPMDMNELPYIVVVVDEFADLMLVAGKDVENAVQRLAQMARAAGIHLIMATQRPSVDVITGVVKANFPTRISFQVTSKIDSRTILGEGGAEQLLGMGDMLYMAPGGRITRVHGPFVSDDDVEKVTDFLKSQAEPHYIDDVTEGVDFADNEIMAAMFGEESGSDKVDELYDRAVAIVAREGKASTSFIQRHLQIGYNRAARIVEEMERQGVISKANAVGKREVLVKDFSDV